MKIVLLHILIRVCEIYPAYHSYNGYLSGEYYALVKDPVTAGGPLNRVAELSLYFGGDLHNQPSQPLMAGIML